MRGLLVALVVMAGMSTARAERRTGRSVVSPPSPCQRAGHHIAAVLADKLDVLVTKRCEADRWSKDVTLCLASAPTNLDTHTCMSKLTHEQRIALEGDADRAGRTRFVLWLVRQSFSTQALPPPTITLAVLTTSDAPDILKARQLHTRGLSAYQAGRYDFAARMFNAALDTNPSPELVYHAAQAYRMTGDRAKALELYEKYLELAPRGPAANACRAQIEKLRDDVP
jgi:tetratricopeptide (TPR) repeat protein